MEPLIEVIGEVLQYSVPAVLVLLVVKYMNDNQVKKMKLAESKELKQEVIKTHLPLKLSAYERAVLFLERISPENLLIRITAANKNAAFFRQELVNEIKTEYEHNLVQQLYISESGWNALVSAKNEIINVVNLSYQELEEGADGLALGKIILTKCSEWKEIPTHKASFVLKSDIRQLFDLSSSVR